MNDYEYGPEERAEIRAEREEQINNHLLKVCSPGTLNDFKEWIEEETNFELYYTDDWLETNTGKLFTTQAVYKKYLVKDLKAV